MADVTLLKFLGATVTSFSSSMGFNSNPSTLSVSLVEDFDAEDDFLADEHSKENEIDATRGGAPFENGNPGTLAKFSVGSFNFTGFVTSYRRSKSVSGNIINVELSDPRFLLSQIPIVNDANLSINQTDFNLTQWNIFCAPAVFTNPVVLDWNESGVRFDRLMSAIIQKPFNFYGKTFYISIDNSFSSSLIGGYRLKQQVSTVQDAIDQAAKEAGIEWYVEIVSDSSGVNIINIKGIARKVQYAFDQDNGLKTFIEGKDGRVSSWEVGRELRQEPTVTIVTGDRVRTLWQTEGGSFNIFSELGNGMVIDRPFVSLDFASTAGWLDFPTVDISLGESVSSPSVGEIGDDFNNNRVEYPTRSKAQVVKSRLGYIATETVLRAALFSKEAWITAVWYTYRSAANGSEIPIPYNLYNDFDLGYGFGAQDAQEVGSFTMNPNKLAIYSPAFDFEKRNPHQSTVNNYSDVLLEAVKEAAYQATLKCAQEYYGRRFICRLPASAICSEIGDSYINNQKKIPIEYSVVDAAPPVPFYNVSTEITFPESFNRADAASFRTQNGLFKPFLSLNGNSLEAEYNYVKYDQFNPANCIWGHKDVSENANSSSTLYYSGISVEPYRFDPRFAIITMNEPVNCGVGSFRKVTPQARVDGRISQFTVETSYVPVTKTDKSGCFLEFMSRVFSDLEIVLHNDDRLPIVGGSRALVSFTNGVISADYYYGLQSDAYALQDNVGLAEYRMTTLDDYGGFYLPLQWNYIKYGPWVNGTSTTRPVSVIDDSKLNPWNYGSFDRMNAAGSIIAERANTLTHTIAYATVTVEGYPELNLGAQLSQGDNNMTNLTDVNLGFGTDGVKTTYRFKSFLGPIGFTKRSEIDMISRNSFSSTNNKDSSIRWDKIYEDIEGQFLQSRGIAQPSFISGTNIMNGNNSTNNSSLDTFSSSINSSGRDPSVTASSAKAVRYTNEANISNYSDAAFAKISSIFIPITTQPPNTAKNRAPTVEGGLQ